MSFRHAEPKFYLHSVCLSGKNVTSLGPAFSIFSIVGKLDPRDLTTNIQLFNCRQMGATVKDSRDCSVPWHDRMW